MIIFTDWRADTPTDANNLVSNNRVMRYGHWYFFTSGPNGYNYADGVNAELFLGRLNQVKPDGTPYCGPKDTICVFDIEPPYSLWGNDMTEKDISSSDWEFAANQYIKALEVFKNFHPFRRVGIYNEIPVHGSGWNLNRYWQYGETSREKYFTDWLEKCEKQTRGYTGNKGIVDYVDFCCPSLYSGDFSEIDNDLFYLRVEPRVSMCRQFNKNCYPYIMPQGHPSGVSKWQLMTGDQWTKVLDAVSIADGVVLYAMNGAFPQGLQTEWFQATVDYFNTNTKVEYNENTEISFTDQLDEMGI